MKKRVASGSNNHILSSALSEISKELRLLAVQRKKLESELKNAKQRVSDAQEKENILKERLSNISTLETKLSITIKNKEHRLADLKEKLNRVRKAREELSEF